MNTDVAIDTSLPDFNSELPAQKAQQMKEDQAALDRENLRRMPAYEALRAKLTGWYERYRTPTFPKEMSYEDIGKEYLLSQQMAVMIKEVLDDLER